MLGENLSGPTDQPCRRLVACPGDDVEVDQYFFASQPPRGAGLIDELDVEQISHDVVGRMLGAPVDVSGELLADRQALFGCHHGLARLGAQLGVAPVADVLLIVFGDAQQHADDFHRHQRAQIGDEVESPRPHQWIQELSAELADHRLQRS